VGVEPEPTRFLALGDSYTVGEAVASEEAWPEQLAARMAKAGRSIQTTIVATTAWTSGELLVALDEEPPAGSFDLVSVQIGVNDQYRGLSLDEFSANARALLDRARQMGGGEPGRIFTVSIPDWGVTPFAAGRDRSRVAADIDRFNQTWRRLAGGAGIPLVDVTLISRRHPHLLAPDGLHPSGRQYRLWVDAITPVVEALVGLRDG